MLELDPRYLTDLAAMVGGFASFLGGFSATFFVTVLTLAKAGRMARVTLALSALAAVSFIVAVAASMSVTLAVHPHRPDFQNMVDLDQARISMVVSFWLGIACLLASIGAGGWVRSKPLGYITTAIAAGGLIVLLFFIG